MTKRDALFGDDAPLPAWAEWPDRKLMWAAEHFKKLRTALHTAYEPLSHNPDHYLRHTTERDDREHILVAQNLPDLSPDLGLMFSDFITNARAVLDYLVYAITERAYAPDPIPPHVEASCAFVFAKTPQAFKSLQPQRIGALPGPAKALIRKLQPYETVSVPYDIDRHELALLDNLANLYKHRRPHIVWHIATTGFFPRIHGASADLNGWPLENGTEVMRFVLPEAKPKMDVKLDAILEFGINLGGEVAPPLDLCESFLRQLDWTLRAFADAVP